MTAPEIIQQIENLGGTLAIDGDRIRCALTDEAQVLVPELRRIRDEVFRALQDRGRPQISMPAGVRLLRWALKPPPVEINTISVVLDPQRFAETTLRQLECARSCGKVGAGRRASASCNSRNQDVNQAVKHGGNCEVTSITFAQLTDRALSWCMGALLSPNYHHTPFSRALECALGAEEARRMRLRTRQCEPDEPLFEVSFEVPRMDAQELPEAYTAMFASAAGYFAMAETAKGTPDFEDFQSAAMFCGAVLQELKCRRMPRETYVLQQGHYV